MSKIGATYLTPDEYADVAVVSIHPASDKEVALVLSQTEEGSDGRSNWLWIRLDNGDLILGTYPQGNTYEAVESDAKYPKHDAA